MHIRMWKLLALVSLLLVLVYPAPSRVISNYVLPFGGFYGAVGVSAATATLPLTHSRPFQAVCEAQGGAFEIATDLRSLYCSKQGELFTAFTERQLAVQETICEQVYGAFFGVEGQLPNTTITFCSTAD